MLELANRVGGFIAALSPIVFIIILLVGALLCYMFGRFVPIVGIVATFIAIAVYAKVGPLVQNGFISFVIAFIVWIIYVYISYRGKIAGEALMLGFPSTKAYREAGRALQEHRSSSVSSGPHDSHETDKRRSNGHQ
jgi:hypothetical protein